MLDAEPLAFVLFEPCLCLFVLVASIHIMHIIVVISRGLKHRMANISGNMDLERRSTKKYRLISPKLDELRGLVSLISDLIGFTARYGALISLLPVKME